MTNVFAGIELGGTKTICVIGSGASGIQHTLNIPTTSPGDILNAVIPFLKSHHFSAIGLASFGPVNVNTQSRNYGEIENTPKPGWLGVNIRNTLLKEFSCPVHVDTDVNGAALAEWQLGAGTGLNNMSYVTVGTGIGVGTVLLGRLVVGATHPEAGHIALPRVKNDEDFESACKFHNSCAEGLASGTAIKKRWGLALNELPEEHEAWDMQAQYLAQLAHSITLMLSPERIIFGGGVSSEALLVKVRDYFYRGLSAYVAHLNSKKLMEAYICLPKLAGDAGPMGALLLAERGVSTGASC